MDNSVIAKSGWLYRQTAVLKKWQKNWIELYRDGNLKYYENECSPNAEDTIFMPTECLAIKAGLQVEAVQPPDGYGIHNLLSIITSTGKTWIFCGESSDDMRAWQLALEQARLFGMHPQMSAQAPQFMAAYNPGFLSTYGECTTSKTMNWKGKMEGFKMLRDSSLPYMPQFAYPQSAYYGYPGLQYMSTAPGQAALVYQPERYIRQDGSDAGLGMLGNPAVGPLSWGPLLWW